jgi:hypothetical protein
MKGRDIVVAAAVAGFVIAADRFYRHPTYGRGWRALLSALDLAEIL